MSTVMLIAHQAMNRAILEKMAASLEIVSSVRAVAKPAEAINVVAHDPPDLVLYDIAVPGCSPLEFLMRLRRLPQCNNLPLIFLTPPGSFPEDIPHFLLDGVTDFLSNPPRHQEFTARCRTLLTVRSHQQMLSNRTAWLEKRVAEATHEALSREQETLLCLARAGEYRDEDTGAHVIRMARYSRVIGEHMGLSAEDCESIERAAPTHDIGKIGVSDSILLKPAPLTDEEFKLLKTHTRIGYGILRGSPSKYLQLGASIALSHHERWDGTGYPAALAGPDIPLAARIVAVADVFDALTSVRPYKAAWDTPRATHEIRQCSGTAFDPECVNAFFDGLTEILRIFDELADEPRNGQHAHGRNGQHHHGDHGQQDQAGLGTPGMDCGETPVPT